jgi:hypothetical protein
MLRLIIQNGTNSGAQLHLEQGWLVLGRGEESVVRFVEPSVSTRHAIIATEHNVPERRADSNGQAVARRCD